MIVFESIGILRKVRKNWFKVLGFYNLTVDRFTNLDRYSSCVPLHVISRILFRHLTDNGGSGSTVIEMMAHLKIRELHWIKANRRVYDVLNIFAGAGIFDQSLPPPLPPPPPIEQSPSPWILDECYHQYQIEDE